MQYDALLIDWRSALVVHMTVMTIVLFLMTPDVSMGLWRSILIRWNARKEMARIRKDREIEDKLKKYWEVDMKEFK